MKPFNFTASQFSYDPEGIKLEERDLMQDVQTKFVPPYMFRQKRSTAHIDEAHTFQTYQVRSSKVMNTILISTQNCYSSYNLHCLLYLNISIKKIKLCQDFFRKFK
jgi:hypothetical protein